eukprot:917238-Amphidinium_carterae.1
MVAAVAVVVVAGVVTLFHRSVCSQRQSTRQFCPLLLFIACLGWIVKKATLCVHPNLQWSRDHNLEHG